MLIRNQDYIDEHGHIARRVSNLETGVHPVSADNAYANAVPPTNIILISPWQQFRGSAADPATPKWQRRFGVVTLMGGVEPSGVDWSAIPADSKCGDLPTGARPLSELVFLVAGIPAPFYGTLRVQTDGGIYVIKPPGALPSGFGLRFDGANWTID